MGSYWSACSTRPVGGAKSVGQPEAGSSCAQRSVAASYCHTSSRFLDALPPKRTARPLTVSKVRSTQPRGPGGGSAFCVQVAVHPWASGGAAAARSEQRMSASASGQVSGRRECPTQSRGRPYRTCLAGNTMISLSCRKTTSSQAIHFALPSAAQPSGSSPDLSLCVPTSRWVCHCREGVSALKSFYARTAPDRR